MRAGAHKFEHYQLRESLPVIGIEVLLIFLLRLFGVPLACNYLVVAVTIKMPFSCSTADEVVIWEAEVGIGLKLCLSVI